MKICIAKNKIEAYKEWLNNEDKSESTITTYLQGIAHFFKFAEETDEKNLSFGLMKKFRESLSEFRDSMKKPYKYSSINTYISALNSFLQFIGYKGSRLKSVKCQKKDYV